MTRTITVVNASDETLMTLPVTTEDSTIHFRHGLDKCHVSFIEITHVTSTDEIWRLHWSDEDKEG